MRTKNLIGDVVDDRSEVPHLAEVDIPGAGVVKTSEGTGSDSAADIRIGIYDPAAPAVFIPHHNPPDGVIY